MANEHETILVIDDSEAIRTKLKAQLSNLGYTVVLAANGRTGLSAVAEHQPLLILLDYQLPDICRAPALRSSRSAHSPPEQLCSRGCLAEP